MTDPTSRAAGGGGPSGVGAPASNWYSEWANRTGLTTRILVYTTIPISILGFFLPLSDYLSADKSIILSGQLWRLFTSLPLCDGIFALLFTLLFLVLQAGRFESTIGSFGFFYYSCVFGAIINLLFAVVAVILLSALPADASFYLLGKNPIASGLWPVIFYFITAATLSDPSGRTPFCFLQIPNKFFPFVLLALFSLLAQSLQLDLLMGLIWGVLDVFGVLKYIKPKNSQVSAWESQSGFLSRWKITRLPGYLLAPAGGGQSDEQNVFSGLNIFGRPRTAQPPAGQTQANTGSGRPSGFSVFQTGAQAPRQPSADNEQEHKSAAFSGVGNRLGGVAPPATSASTNTEAARNAARAAALARLQNISASSKAANEAKREQQDTASPAPAVVAKDVLPTGPTQSPAVVQEDFDEDDRAHLLSPGEQARPTRGAAAHTTHTTAPKAAISSVALTQLIGMGHSEDDARNALLQAEGDVDVAELLLSYPSTKR